MNTSKALLKGFSTMNGLPGGKWLFTKAVCLNAPYFSTIKPTVVDLRKGHCSIKMTKRRAVHNHIKTVHAIAMCNLAEMTMGLIAEASVPGHLRWLPKAMEVQYLAKAETDLHSICVLEPNCWDSAPNVPVTVKIYDTNNVEVMRAIIQIWVTAKK